MGLETSKGSKGYSPELKLLEQRGYNNESAINALTGAAKLEEVQTVMSALQLVVAKTYAKVLHKETGRTVSGLQDDLGISEMLVRERITCAELEEFGRLSQVEEFRHTAYSPLPSKQQAYYLFKQIRAKLFSASRAALTLRFPPALPESAGSQPMTPKAARVALDLGFFPLMGVDQRKEVFRLVGWADLPIKVKHCFYWDLPYEKRAEIMKEQDIQKREKQTANEYSKIYSKKQAGGECDGGRACENAEGNGSDA